MSERSDEIPESEGYERQLHHPKKWAVFSLFGGVWRFFNYFKKSETGIDSDYVS